MKAIATLNSFCYDVSKMRVPNASRGGDNLYDPLNLCVPRLEEKLCVSGAKMVPRLSFKHGMLLLMIRSGLVSFTHSQHISCLHNTTVIVPLNGSYREIYYCEVECVYMVTSLCK